MSNVTEQRAGGGQPERIGRYRILHVLGEGGMGIVYEAEQDNPRRTVALKVIKSGLATPSHLRRFEQEAQVLGRLNHPGIAQIYDAGTADAGAGLQPYFAMELVDGETLTEWADSRDLGTRARMELMAKVADAVHHAHQKGVIHRDLKPANILVDGGQPKVLDFGVARSTDADVQATMRTDVGQLLGTVPYMSPEQVSADPDDLDIRSDVYGLGVVLYELLAGRLPYDLSKKMIPEALRIIRDQDPTPLSSVQRVFRGDVETIVGKALEKDRTRRYQSANELAADIRRYLDDEAIVARPPSAAYQARKFAQRHKAIVSAVLVGILTLVAGTVVSVWQAVRATRAETLATQNAVDAQRAAREALEQAAKSDAVREFLEEMLAAANPYRGVARDVTVREMLDAAAVRLEHGAAAAQPDLDAAVRRTIGATYRALDLFDSAEPLLRAALSTNLRLHGEDHLDVARTRYELAVLLTRAGRSVEAAAEAEQALAVLRRLLDGPHQTIASCLIMLASAKYNQADLEHAERLHREALTMRRALFGQDHADVADSLNALAFLRLERGAPRDAEVLFREGVEVAQRVLGAEHPKCMDCLVGLGSCLQKLSKFAEAERVLRQALEIARTAFEPDHTRIADVLIRLGDLAQIEGRLDEAEPLLEEALRIRQARHGTHRDVATALTSLGRLQKARRDYDGAAARFEAALAMRVELWGEDSVAVASSLEDLGELRRLQQRPIDAEPLLRRALAIWAANPDDNESRGSDARYSLGMLLQTRGDLDGAETLFRERVTLGRRVYGEEHERVASAMNVLASLLFRQGKFEECEQMLRSALEIRGRLGLADHPDAFDNVSNLAFVLDHNGSYAEARTQFEACIKIARAMGPRGADKVRGALTRLAGTLQRQGDWVASEPPLRESLNLAEQLLAPDDWRRANTESLLGETLLEQQHFAAAEPLLLRAHAALEHHAEAPARAREAAGARVVRLYEAQGDAAQAAAWRAKLERSR